MPFLFCLTKSRRRCSTICMCVQMKRIKPYEKWSIERKKKNKEQNNEKRREKEKQMK